MFKSTVGILVILFTSMMIGCSNAAPENFHRGDVVEMKIDGRKGMVLTVSTCLGERSCIYNVRFSTGSVHTDTHMLSKDGPLKTMSYEIVRVYDYELTLAESTKK